MLSTPRFITLEPEVEGWVRHLAAEILLQVLEVALQLWHGRSGADEADEDGGVHSGPHAQHEQIRRQRVGPRKQAYDATCEEQNVGFESKNQDFLLWSYQGALL